LSLRHRCFATAVTAIELHAGAHSREHQAAVVQLLTVFSRFDRLLAPTGEEWVAAGRLIAHARWRQGDMEPRDHYPDVLIAYMAARIGATLVTANVADFRRWVVLGGLDIPVRNEP
jgi:predicted nucleic acid-binding protein